MALASIGCSAHAELPENACDFAHRQLSSVPNLRLKKSTENFADSGHVYGGADAMRQALFLLLHGCALKGAVGRGLQSKW